MSKQDITNHKKIVVAVNTFEEAFENSLSFTDSNITYIKPETLKEWVDSDGGNFNFKMFGDKESNMFMTFIFKDGDKEFERENIESKILDFKRLKFLQQFKNKS